MNFLNCVSCGESRSRMGVLFGLLMGCALSASATVYPYPYPYQQQVAQQVPLSFSLGGGTSKSLSFDKPDIRSGELLSISAQFSSPLVINAAGKIADGVTTEVTEDHLLQVSGIGSAFGFRHRFGASCSGQGCYNNFPYNFTNFTGHTAGGSQVFAPSQQYDRNHARDYHPTELASGGAGGSIDATLSVSAPSVVKPSFDWYDVTTTSAVSLTFNFRPWTTGDAIATRVDPPKLSHGFMDFTVGTNFGFTAKEAAHLSNYDNFNWLVSLTAYCSNIIGNALHLQPCDATHNDNAKAPTEIGRNIPQFDGQAGGNQNSNTRNPAGADNFDLYFDQVLSSNQDRAEFFVGDQRNANGLRFFDQPDLLKAGRVLVFHNELVGWDEADQTWDLLSEEFNDPNFAFNWRWIQTGDTATQQCDPANGVTLNCGFAVSGGLIDPTLDVGVAEFLGFGDVDPSLFFADIDQGLFEEMPGGGGGTPPGEGSAPVPMTVYLMLSGLAGFSVQRRRRCQVTPGSFPAECAT
ncbi:MAG: hypothetical protein R3E46_12975 [Sedimenticolaceae bacterium]